MGELYPRTPGRREAPARRCSVRVKREGAGVWVPLPCCRADPGPGVMEHLIPDKPVYPCMLVQCPLCLHVWLLRRVEGEVWDLEWAFWTDP